MVPNKNNALRDVSIKTSGPRLAGIQNYDSDEGKLKKNIVAFHGWQDNCASFLNLITLMEEYNWLAFDFPGHGLSEWRSNDCHYYFVDYIDDIYQVITTQYDEPVHIVGHSMGAMAASLFSACFPELVLSVTLIEGIGLISTHENEVVQQLRNAILHRKKNTKNIKQNNAKYYQNFDTLVKARMAVSDLNYEECKLLMKRNATVTEQGVKLTIDPKLKQHSGFRFNEAQIVTVCKNIKSPVLVVLGKTGMKQIKQAVDIYAHHYRNLKIREVAGGHHCHIQNPQEVAKLLSSFIA
ncbi:alpha/beta fold hydrolase [Pseudoalteromonas denitrificans]|uniref:Pimeloyl-ACP methyl ester carboxylesterase n=1 Tax=Pseudoalteromonas denitrificans DSM 6059 TaxID=1123010 RepID=A0A1I1GR94_9GAMM|nr:alpha/beta hydrolase [Pseudoalteromonas denitrificans]SFC14164.1 Pimeloyl-ACP methyl ester carboxylesterase [Pseudoalteromonas denitrificans DSM 6059]